MDDWEDIDENITVEEESDEEIIDYCSECGEPIHETDIYEIMNDGRILCEICCLSQHNRN